MEKPFEYWIALLTGVLIVIERNREKRMRARVMIAAISGGVGYVLTPEVAAWLGRSETIVIMILTALGYLLMDTAISVIADREFIREIIRSRLGGGEGR